MNCTACNAQLAPGSTTCYFCGARQAQAVRTSHARPAHGASWRGPGGPPHEGWRTWTSFFLAGLYAPIASAYLVRREEHLAGLRRGQLPPTSPSQVGRVVLWLFAGVPALVVMVLAFSAHVSSVRRASRFYESGEDAWVGLGTASHILLVNLSVGLFFAVSVCVARWARRRFELLIEEITQGDPHVVSLYREGRAGRVVAAATGFAPLAFLGVYVVTLAAGSWHPALSELGLAWVPLVGAAAWATSWLNIQAATRYRAVLSVLP